MKKLIVGVVVSLAFVACGPDWLQAVPEGISYGGPDTVTVVTESDDDAGTVSGPVDNDPVASSDAGTVSDNDAGSPVTVADAGTSGGTDGGVPPVCVCKPGWGYGDKNHCHYGPPGKVGKLISIKTVSKAHNPCGASN